MIASAVFLVVCIVAAAVAWSRLGAARESNRPFVAPIGAAPERPRDPPHAAASTLDRAPRAQARAYGRVFEFAFVDKGGAEGWRIYILRQPGYGAWAQGAHESHRYFDSQQRCHFICIDESKKPIRSLAAAARFAQLWAKGTVRYIDTGRGF